MVKTNEELECPSEECGRKEIFNNDIFSQCDHAVYFFPNCGLGCLGCRPRPVWPDQPTSLK